SAGCEDRERQHAAPDAASRRTRGQAGPNWVGLTLAQQLQIAARQSLLVQGGREALDHMPPGGPAQRCQLLRRLDRAESPNPGIDRRFDEITGFTGSDRLPES